MRLLSKHFLQKALNNAAYECLEGIHDNGNFRVDSLRRKGFSDPQILEIQRRVNVLVHEGNRRMLNDRR